MISVNGTENEYVLDLNNSDETHYELEILSQSNEKSSLPWGIETSNGLDVYKISKSKIALDFDLEALKSSTLIVLRNYAKERVRIKIKPNLRHSADKTYNFSGRVTKKTDLGFIISVKSEMNELQIPWKVSYDGFPLSFDFSSKSHDKGEKMSVELVSELHSEAFAVIVLEQEGSNKKLKVNVWYTFDEESKTYKIRNTSISRD